MNIYHLKYFIDAARLQSVSKAATANHISHSAVSQGIKSLESFLGVELLVHSKRRFQLTAQGERFLIEGQHLLDSLESAKKHIRSKENEVSGELILWAPQSLIVDSLYETLALYRKSYPKVNISLKTGAAAQVRAAISSSDAHVGLLVDDGFLGGFESLEVKKGRFILIAKSKGEEIDGASIIVTGKDKVEVDHLRKRYKAKFKKEISISMEVMSWGVIKNLVMKKFGIGYVPDYCVIPELEAGKLHLVPSPGTQFQYEVKAIWQRQRGLHPNAKLFLDLLSEHHSENESRR
ncbi:MAG: LysR family transcriptional regulator [Bdellovibrionota bacterium]